ncbi:hypothetical protein [Pontibacter roseus]|uniref:hypothetical protein n=1 Tax=Pontibacter roseus TaxID=336989 RepID=UPI000364C711|nr:hypothetical protein [Pontibacter roseus]
MYISLFSAKQLEQIKRNMLWLGLFFFSGGMAAFLNDVFIREETRWYWALAAALICVTGVLLVAVGTGRVQLKEAYFSMTPAMISYKLSLFSSERQIYWQQVHSVQVSERYILFDLNGGRQVLMRLGLIQSPSAASQLAMHVQMAAAEHHVKLTGMRIFTQSPGGAA